MKGAEQLARRGSPLAHRGFGEGEWGDQGARAKGSLPRSLRFAGLGGGEVNTCAAASAATAPS